MNNNKNVLSKKAIIHLTKLSKLTLHPSEFAKLQNKLEASLEYVKNLKNINTQKITSLDYITQENNITRKDIQNNKRTLSSKEALMNAKNIKNNYFVVKKIL